MKLIQIGLLILGAVLLARAKYFDDPEVEMRDIRDTIRNRHFWQRLHQRRQMLSGRQQEPEAPAQAVEPQQPKPQQVEPQVVTPVVPQEVVPQVVTQVVPQVVPQQVAPQVVPQQVIPQVVPQQVVPQVVPQRVVPQVVPQKVVPQQVVPQVVQQSISHDAARCHWSGTAPFCHSTCGRSFRAVRLDVRGDGKACLTGIKRLCCPSPKLVQAKINHARCHWSGTAPFCRGRCGRGFHAIRLDSRGDGKACWTGMKKFCCPSS